MGSLEDLNMHVSRSWYNTGVSGPSLATPESAFRTFPAIMKRNAATSDLPLPSDSITGICGVAVGQAERRESRDDKRNHGLKSWHQVASSALSTA
ncbi:Hypp5009 [Branchiostoma lanceolatum]|uniref:Hypp5009 protein n=1 Tax=Branchiostoma lanceolatum TaxID=7740 RepID=A0A8K0F2U5_BRALA|nr:Hypp5009 [Branchiostoma lanceolatum]